jgi:rhodanese-related sulfurtransferase
MPAGLDRADGPTARSEGYIAAVASPGTRAAELLERGEVVVLDVRENLEWKAGRIPGALHIPLAQVPFRGRELPRDTTIVTVCRSGHRSGLAARWLRRAGYRVEDLAGGMKA